MRFWHVRQAPATQIDVAHCSRNRYAGNVHVTALHVSHHPPKYAQAGRVRDERNIFATLESIRDDSVSTKIAETLLLHQLLLVLIWPPNQSLLGYKHTVISSGRLDLRVQGATSVLFFEARKRSDLYLWMAKVPSGPSIRFLCSNVHTMAELKLSGNHLKGSRPVLSFDAAFDEQPQLQVCLHGHYPAQHICCVSSSSSSVHCNDFAESLLPNTSWSRDVRDGS